MTELRYDTTTALEELLRLVPSHTRARDDETGGTLRAVLTAVGEQLAVLENDIDELYSSWFIETCPEWVVPYIADLVGLTDLPPDLSAGGSTGAAVSRRAVVANTVAYRRRKGTAAVIEQVARDVTGWPTRVVEYHRLLAATAHVNHVRIDRPATASLRSADALDLVPPAVASGALDPLPHLAEVRHISSGRGRYGIANVGVFLFPHQVYAVTASAPRATADGWTVDPLGWATPLFAVPTTEGTIEHLAEEPDLPVPLRPRRLLARLQVARASAVGDDLPVSVTIDTDPPLEPERVRVCGLEDLARDGSGDPITGWQVMVDAVSGRLHLYLDGAPTDPGALAVSYAYGSSADVGAGPYDRSETHEDALTGDRFAGDPARGGREVRAQVQVLASGSAPGSATSISAAVTDLETSWSGPDSPAGATAVLSIGDSATYVGDLSVTVPDATRLVVVAAGWETRVLGNGDVLPPAPGVYSPEGLRPCVVGDLTIVGGEGSSVVLDGLVIDGDLVVKPSALGSLVLSQCTIRGRVRVESAPGATNQDLAVTVVRTIAAGFDLVRTVPELTICDSIVDPALDAAGPSAAAVEGAGVHLVVEGSTVRGPVTVRTLDASSAIFEAVVSVEDRQVGCVRFSALAAGSRAPRRYRCIPATDNESAPGPAYVSAEPGSPSYLVLAAGSPQGIRTGGESGGEMGVHHHLRRPLRVDAARRLLAPYVPVGLEIGIVGS